MARFCEPTEDNISSWMDWIAERPAHVQAVAARFDPWTLYRLGEDGHRVRLLGFQEYPDGSVKARVLVSGKYNFVTFDREVFGIDPDILKECELPGEDEIVGSVADLMTSMEEA